mgnify:CR=1 FL=1
MPWYRGPTLLHHLDTLPLEVRRADNSRVVARRPLVLAGLGLLDVVFAAYGGRCRAKPLAYDGQFVPAGAAASNSSSPDGAGRNVWVVGSNEVGMSATVP